MLIDEFGKGTAPQGSLAAVCSLDGIALFLSSLVFIHASQPPHSLFLLSTHFSDYLEHEALQPLRASLTLKQMNVILDAANGNLVTPLFQVVDGVCQDSLGIRCARAFGMPQEITERAQQVRLEARSRIDLRLHPREQGGAHRSESHCSEESGKHRSPAEHALRKGGLDEGLRRRGGAVHTEHSRDWGELIALFVLFVGDWSVPCEGTQFQNTTHCEGKMGRKGQDGYDDRRKSHTAKKPTRKYNDQSTPHVRGYKEVDRQEME